MGSRQSCLVIGGPSEEDQDEMFTSDCYLGPCAGTQTTVFQLRSHTCFRNLMKLRFSMSHHRKNSVRDKVTGKKQIYLERNTDKVTGKKRIYLERNTLHRVWAISGGEGSLMVCCG